MWFFRHFATAPRRNSPCPCNSGKKFKHCCALQ
ncbi:SEC-C metal-binding domain-containing protein [Desulfotalea psychrophila]